MYIHVHMYNNYYFYFPLVDCIKPTKLTAKLGKAASTATQGVAFSRLTKL